MTTVAQPTAAPLARQWTAEQFVRVITPFVEVEADFTEQCNEDRTLGDYLADLAAACQRVVDGEIILRDPATAEVHVLDRPIRAKTVVDAAGDLIGTDLSAVHPEYVRGAWETALTAIGVTPDEAREPNGDLGGRATRDALHRYVPIMGGGAA